MGVTSSTHSVSSTFYPSPSHPLTNSHSARKTDPPRVPTPRELLSSNPYTPTSTLAQSIMHSSPLLTELIVVREWLQETAPQPHHPEACTGYWKFTKHGVMQALRTGDGGRRDGLVKEMDPDAVNREEGKALAADDSVSLCVIRHSFLEFKIWTWFYRVMKKAYHNRFIAISGQGDSKKRLNCVGLPISHGAPRVFEGRCYSNINLLVRHTSPLIAFLS